jgi:heat shock protein HtpX
MSENIKQYQIKATDWRSTVEKNERNTRIVIILFVLIYLAVGILIDVYINFSIHISRTHEASITPKVPITVIAMDVLTFKILPLASIIMLAIAFCSLTITFLFHKSLVMLGTDYHEVTQDESIASEERQLYNVVEELKIAAGLNFMPKIFIIDADYMNAFASGYNEKSALVAITRGLMQKLNRDELQAVMAHELSHIRHDDIRLLLTVTILSNLTLIAIDLLFRFVIYSPKKGRDNGLALVIIILRFVLPILTLLLMLYLSRTRELMADAGSVELLRNNEPLADALLKIDADHKTNVEIYSQAYAATSHEQVRQASYLYDPKDAGIRSFQSLNDIFSTHPSLEERLKALGVEKRL